MNEKKTFDFEIEIKSDSLGEGEFSGYAAVFSNVDRVRDVILPGAFKKSLPDFRENGFISWQHDWNIPIGKILDIKEDSKGLYVHAKLSMTSAGKDAMTLLRDNVIKKLSIGYRTDEEQLFGNAKELLSYLSENNITMNTSWLEKETSSLRNPVNLLKKLSLMEISLVSIPANPLAVITNVKNEVGYKFAEYGENLLLALAEYLDRAKEVSDIRAKDNRELSKENKVRIEKISRGISTLLPTLNELTKSNSQLIDEAKSILSNMISA